MWLESRLLFEIVGLHMPRAQHRPEKCLLACGCPAYICCFVLLKSVATAADYTEKFCSDTDGDTAIPLRVNKPEMPFSL